MAARGREEERKKKRDSQPRYILWKDQYGHFQAIVTVIEIGFFVLSRWRQVYSILKNKIFVRKRCDRFVYAYAKMHQHHVYDCTHCANLIARWIQYLENNNYRMTTTTPTTIKTKEACAQWVMRSKWYKKTKTNCISATDKKIKIKE